MVYLNDDGIWCLLLFGEDVFNSLLSSSALSFIVIIKFFFSPPAKLSVLIVLGSLSLDSFLPAIEIAFLQKFFNTQFSHLGFLAVQ